MQAPANKMLTIVIPAYNVERYIGQCLDSLVRQTCRRFCAIIVDDGSTDGGTSRIAQEYAAAHPDWIEYVRQDNKGLGAARNAGLDRVTTPYVTFLDSDDWLDVRYVEVVLEKLEKYDDDAIDITFTMPTIFDSITHQMWGWNDQEMFDNIFRPECPIVEAAFEERLFHLEPSVCRRVLRTAFLRQYDFHFPEGTRWEDVLPHFQMLTRARKCLGIREVGFFYRINVPTSITSTGSRSRLEIAPVFRSVFDYLIQGNYSLGIRNSAVKMCISFSMWSLSMSQQNVRTELVECLYNLYTTLPKNLLKDALAAPYLLGEKEKVFVNTILSRSRHHLLIDYMPSSAAQIMLDKLRALKHRLHL